MSVRFLAFALWVLFVLAGCVAASFNAWSPYSDDERPAPGSVYRGPTHK